MPERGYRMFSKLKQRQQKLLTEERGTIRKNWGGRIRIALVFANRYSVGMSNLGFQSVYGALNQFDDIVCERVFYPEPEDLPIFRKTSGRLFSLESQRPLRDFDLVAFSIPYENDYANALEMLHLAGLTVRSEDRDEGQPIVAAGGVALFLNPEPLAPFMDFIFIGEAEALLPDFLQVWKDTRGSRSSRKHFLGRLAKEVSGIYVPSLYDVVFHQDGTLQSMEPLPGSGAPERISYRRADLDGSPPCQTVVRTPNAEFSDVTLIEIGRGCGRGCRFCAAGFVYRPLRVHAADKLMEVAKPAIAEGPRLGLVSAAVSDHPEISYLCQSLLDLGGTLSFSSLRADTLTPEIASALQSSRHRSVAIAPEAGSERMRRVINKNLSAEDIFRAADQLTEMGIIHLKLYFMIGLPTETQEDLEGLVDLAKRIKHHVLKISRGRKQMGTITLSIHSFVPKAFTPFQWASFAGVRVLKDRSRWIQKALQRIPNVRVHFDLPKWAYVQALLARGDRRASQFLEKVGVGGLSWMQSLRETPHNPDFWVMRERGENERFPWEIIDYSIRRSYLWSEYRRALEGKVSPPCTLDEGCRVCGVCGP
jgi:radical SAM family uncharacterized protein